MKNAAMAVLGLVLTAMLTACGGGPSEAEAEKDARAELKELGLSKSLTDCAIDGIKKEAGSFGKYIDLPVKEQQTIAAAAGSKCATNLSDEEVGDLGDTLDDQGVDFSDPAMRDSFITGMTTQGVSEEVANCILDKMIDQKLELSDVTNPEIITRLAQECQ